MLHVSQGKEGGRHAGNEDHQDGRYQHGKGAVAALSVHPFREDHDCAGKPGRGEDDDDAGHHRRDFEGGEELSCGREVLTASATDFISGTAQPLTSIYQSAEDGLADTVKPRLPLHEAGWEEADSEERV